VSHGSLVFVLILILFQKALNFDYDFDSVCSSVKVNQRIPESEAVNTTLADYLFSRSIAGMNASELIQNIKNATNGQIDGCFFPFYPPVDLNLGEWLVKCLRKRAVPVALLNLQKTSFFGIIPDAWHHQMIYGCDSDLVYLTNPLETKPFDLIRNELTSESVLLVRTEDVLKRFNANKTNLDDLASMSKVSENERKRWLEMDVLGQVVEVLGENGIQLSLDPNRIGSNGPRNPIHPLRHESNNFISHIVIPASYVPGITLFARSDSSLFKEIKESTQ
jgi:hypothetical protein